MVRALSHRPLAVAGLAILISSLWGSQFGFPGPWIPLLLGGAIACRGLRGGQQTASETSIARSRVLVVALLASSVGLQSGRSQFAATHAAETTRRGWAARDPPHTLVTADLVVRTSGENPWSGRAWILGDREDGIRLECSWPGVVPDGVGAGTHVRVTGRLSVPRGPTNPGQRDMALAWTRKGVAGRLFLKSPNNLELRGGTVAPWRAMLRQMRRRAAYRLRRELSASDAGVACALLLGWRTGLSAEDRLRFERTGTMHLLAISGMHLLLVAGLVHGLSRRFGAGLRTAALCALTVALIYVPIAGAGAPVRRAAVVLATHALALARGRRPDPASSLGGALVLLVILDPVEVYRLGFWLSFLAAVAIATLATRWSAQWSERTRLLARFPAVRADRPLRLRLARYVWSGLAVSLAAGCATQPLIAWRFGIATPLSPITNLLAAPFITVLMPLVAAQAAGASALAPIVGATLAALRGVLDLCAALPGMCVPVAPPDMLALAIWFAGVIVLVARPRMGLALLGVALLCAWPERRLAPPTLTLLDVGHGQAVLVRDRKGVAVLIDAGSRNRPAVGRSVVIPALREAGIAELACCVVSHGDADHWRGLLPLFGRIRMRHLIVGGTVPPLLQSRAKRHGVPLRHARAGDTLWSGDGASVELVADGHGLLGCNDQSLVLLVRLGTHRILIPADRETEGIRALLRQSVATCAVMVAPHHGAALRPVSLAHELADAVRPHWVLTSSARGFADPATLAAYGSRRWSTFEHGSLRLAVAGDGSLELLPWRGGGATIAAP